jgi:hypothetical protein
MKTHSIGTLVLFLLFIDHVEAQYWTPAGGRSSAMGTASVALTDFWSTHNNQAGMAFATQAFGTHIGYSGNPSYNILKTGLAYARTFGDRFSTGIQLDILRTGLADGYGNRTSATFETGILAKITDELTLGAHLFNPVHSKLSDYNNERIPTIMNAGLCYIYSGMLQITTEVKKNSELPMEFLAGAEYKFFENGFIRVGFATNPFRYTFGFGLKIKNLNLDISSSFHESLGYSPQTSMQYAFGNK